MKIDQYHYLREMELEAALFESQQDIENNRFTTGNINKHVDDIF